jgi:NAD(P)-dependent dehydrogenase (short-subunit alcohol dehydrogenase family)
MSPSATNEINDQKIVSDISLPDNIPESAQTAAARVPGDQLFSLKNQTILITGAGRGLGIELALGVVENGGHVAALDILETPSEEEWAHLQKTAKQRGVTVSYRKADITDEEDFKAAVAEISSRGREVGAPLQGAIACAGIQQKIPTLEYPVADFERMLRVNTVGMFRFRASHLANQSEDILTLSFVGSFITAKAVANDMVANKIQGSIVLIASMSGSIANRVSFKLHQPNRAKRSNSKTHPNPAQQGLTCSAYNTSKAAVHQLCRSMAQEIGQHGIRINTLSPGVSFHHLSHNSCNPVSHNITVHPNRYDRRPPSRRARGRKNMDGRCFAGQTGRTGRFQGAGCVLAIEGEQFHDGH